MQAGYYHTAWSDIKNSPKWFGKLCLLALISFIPIFGSIVVYGYAFGWARDIAWNIHAPMPQRIFGNEDGRLYSRGFFALVIMLVFSIPAIVFYAGFAGLSAGENSGIVAMLFGLLSLACAIAAIFFSWVGIMRMAIYGRLSPGFQVKQIWKMMEHDFGGLGRILGMVMLVGFIMGMVISFIATILLIIGGLGFAMQVAATGFDVNTLSGDPSMVLSLVPSMSLLIVVMMIVAYFGTVATMFINLLSARALGYWTRQFEVPSWGGQDDPLPFETRPAASYDAAQAQPYYQQPVSAQLGQQAYQQGANPAAQAQAYGQQPSGYDTQAPAWITHANATAPQPQADPYTRAPGQQGFAQGSAAAPFQAQAPAQEVAQPVAAVQPTAQAQPFSAQPAQTQPFSQQPAQDQPLSQEGAQAFGAPAEEPVQAAPAVQGAVQTPEAAQTPEAQSLESASRDMHHKLQAKPAPRWEKIDIDSLQ